MAQKLSTKHARRAMMAARRSRALPAMEASVEMARAGCFAGTEEANALYQRMRAERDRQNNEPSTEEPKP